MKVFIVLAAFVAVASAGSLGYGPEPAAIVSTGSSTQFRSQDSYGNYNFGYDESHATGGSSRREEESNGVRRGSYSLTDADGRRRVVNYVADANGFRANIDTNEPGVEPKDSAAVYYNKQALVAVAAPAYAAPAPIVAAAPAYAAPAPAYAAPAPIYDAQRAFTYSYGSTHASPIVSAPVYAAAPAPAYAAPAAPEPVYRDY